MYNLYLREFQDLRMNIAMFLTWQLYRCTFLHICQVKRKQSILILVTMYKLPFTFCRDSSQLADQKQPSNCLSSPLIYSEFIAATIYSRSLKWGTKRCWLSDKFLPDNYQIKYLLHTDQYWIQNQIYWGRCHLLTEEGIIIQLLLKD